MKKLIPYFTIIIIAIFLTFMIFENLSWYHFGDFPTKVVFLRLIIFFIFLTILLCVIYKILKKIKTKEK